MGMFSKSPSRAPRAELGRAITSAARMIEADKGTSATPQMSRSAEWYKRVWELYDEVGEVHYAARFYGDAFAAIVLYPAYREDPSVEPDKLVLESERPDPKDQGEAAPEPLPYTDVEVNTCRDTLARLRNPQGGQSEIQRRYGVNSFMVGDCWLVGRPMKATDDEDDESDAEPLPTPIPTPTDPGAAQVQVLPERWDVLSVEEITVATDEKRPNSEGKTVPTVYLKGPGTGQGKKLPADTVTMRLWRPHPRWSELADSPMRAATPIVEELLLLTKAIAAGAASRTSGAGVWCLPNSMREAAAAHATAQGEDPKVDPTTRDILMVAGKSILDPASAASRVPVIVWMPDTVWKDMGQDKLIQWDREVDKVAADQRQELIHRFAVAIDLPPEILTGKAGLNHWSAWNIDDEMFRNHLEPNVKSMCEALTEVFFRPALAAAGVQNPERFVLWYDASALVSDPDTGKRALEAYEADLIGAAPARRDLGYIEEDAPSAEELETKAKLRAARRPALSGPGQPPRDAESPDEDMPDEADQPAAARRVQATVGFGAGIVAGVEQDTREVVRTVTAAAVAHDDRLSGLGDAMAEMDLALMRDVQQMADAAMRRTLERVNARVRSLAQRDTVAKGVVANLQPAMLEVAPALGPQVVAQLLGAEEDEMLAAGFASLELVVLDRLERVSDQAMEAASEAGELDDEARLQLMEQFEEERHGAWEVMLASLIALASARLYSPNPEEPPGEVDGLLVPAGELRPALVRAGGGGLQAVSMMSGDLLSSMWLRAGIAWGGWKWRYGDASLRRSSFRPHAKLDRRSFSDQTDQALANHSGWPTGSFYWPGDHKGCLCTIARADASPLGGTR